MMADRVLGTIITVIAVPRIPWCGWKYWIKAVVKTRLAVNRPTGLNSYRII